MHGYTHARVPVCSEDIFPFLLPPCGSWGSNSGPQAWQLAHTLFLTMEPSQVVQRQTIPIIIFLSRPSLKASCMVSHGPFLHTTNSSHGLHYLWILGRTQFVHITSVVCNNASPFPLNTQKQTVGNIYSFHCNSSFIKGNSG